MAGAINSKENLFNQLYSNKKKIRSFGVEKIGVFGSFVTGNINEESDVDLLVEFEPTKKSFDNFMELSFFLEDLLKRRVELITKQSLNKYLGPHILNQTEYVSIYP